MGKKLKLMAFHLFRAKFIFTTFAEHFQLNLVKFIQNFQRFRRIRTFWVVIACINFCQLNSNYTVIFIITVCPTVTANTVGKEHLATVALWAFLHKATVAVEANDLPPIRLPCRRRLATRTMGIIGGHLNFILKKSQRFSTCQFAVFVAIRH